MSKYLITYSAVVDGQGNPFGRPEDHERDVENLLKTLMASKTGNAVFRKIVAHGVVRIIPYMPSRHTAYGTCNALAPGDRHREKVASGLTRPAVKIEYSTGTWGTSSTCIKGPGFKPDEILLHELVHSMRHLSGDLRQVPLTGNMAHFKDEEEYFATLVANIYISEMGRQPAQWLVGSGNSGLRLSYGSGTIPDDQALSVDFLMFGDNYRLVKKFCQQHPNIAPLIGEATMARFNPIRVFYHWQKHKIEPRAGALVRSR